VPWVVRNHAKGLTAAQVELTVTSVPAEVKREYTICSVVLLKTPSYCTRVAANAQTGLGEERKAGTGREENVSNGQKFTKEDGQAQFLRPMRSLQRKGEIAELEGSVARFGVQMQADWRKFVCYSEYGLQSGGDVEPSAHSAAVIPAYNSADL